MESLSSEFSYILAKLDSGFGFSFVSLPGIWAVYVLMGVFKFFTASMDSWFHSQSWAVLVLFEKCFRFIFRWHVYFFFLLYLRVLTYFSITNYFIIVSISFQFDSYIPITLVTVSGVVSVSIINFCSVFFPFTAVQNDMFCIIFGKISRLGILTF